MAGGREPDPLKPIDTAIFTMVSECPSRKNPSGHLDPAGVPRRSADVEITPGALPPPTARPACAPRPAARESGAIRGMVDEVDGSREPFAADPEGAELSHLDLEFD